MRVRERFLSIKLRKIIRTPIASRRLERIGKVLVNICADDGDDSHYSFGSADSINNYDYCRTRNRREISEAAGKSGGFVLRRLKAFRELKPGTRNHGGNR